MLPARAIFRAGGKMPITAEFEYVKPKDMDEALHVFSLYREKARALAGGTDLVVHLKEGLARPEVVVDIKSLEEIGRASCRERVWKGV